MNVYFRADASAMIGTGHLMRCLALAEALRRRNASCIFICRGLPDALATRIATAGHRLIDLGAVEDWRSDAAATIAAMDTGQAALVVDHYGLGADWESTLRPHVACLLALDDAPARAHDCDVLLDQNLQGCDEARYATLAAGSHLLLGPAYALLRPEFAAAHDGVTARRAVRRLFICFGGSDPTDESAKAHAVLSVRPDLEADIVLGPAYAGTLAPSGDGTARLRILRDPADFLARMAAADLALGAGGISIWERCCLGLPALCIAVAANQEPVARASAAAGVLRYLGTSNEATAERLEGAIDVLCAAPKDLAAMSRRAWECVDGRGAERVSRVVMEFLEQPSRGLSA